MEYIIIFAVILAAILTMGIIDKSKGSSKKYLTKANAAMTTLTTSGVAWAPTGRSKAGGGELAVSPDMPGVEDGADYDLDDAEAAKRAAEETKQNAKDDMQKRYDEAKKKLDALTAKYKKEKAEYDTWRVILDPFIWIAILRGEKPDFDSDGLWPAFKNTRNGWLLQMQIDAYTAMTEGLAGSLKALE